LHVGITMVASFSARLPWALKARSMIGVRATSLRNQGLRSDWGLA